MKKLNLIILITLSTILCLNQTIQAKEFHIADGRQLFLAFSEASNNGENDIIFLAAGVYKGEFIFETSEANSLTLTAEPGLKPEQVVFDGEDMVRPLYISADVEADIEVGNITIRNGKTDEDGGGIYINTNASVSFYNNIIFSNNSGTSGGGAYIRSNESGILSITKNMFSYNNATSSGGGIDTYSKGHIRYIHNYLIRNSSSSTSSYSYGGGICANSGGEIIFKNNNVTGNSAFANGNYSYGGGIYANTGCDILFINNNVTENLSYASANLSYGGGLYANTSGSISLSNNNVTDNSSFSDYHFSYGGAIYINNTKNILISNNSICRNSATARRHNTYGGAIYFNSNVKKITAIENTISDNSSEFGGAIYTSNTENFILSNNTISQNNSDAIRSTNASSIEISSNKIKGTTGTGIYITASSDNSITCAIYKNVIMNNNNQSSEGGGIFVENYKIIDVHQNLIANNQATKGAGMYLNPASILFLGNNTIASNTAEIQGGGIYVTTSNMLYDLSLNNNIFWSNTAGTEGDDIYLNGFGGNPRELYNNTVREISGSFENTSGNINSDPLFYDPANGDYHLRPNSPCINAANNGEYSDLDNTPTYQTCDMGAYEYNPTIPHPADTNSNFTIEESEYTAYNNAWRSNLPWTNTPENIPIEYNTRAGFLAENGGAYTNTGAMKPLCWTPNQ
jgi:parallel beta-helix repeat protein